MSGSQTHFEVYCPTCSSRLSIKRTSAGKQVTCKACGNAFLAEEKIEPVTPDSGSFIPIPLDETPAPDERISAHCPNCHAPLRVRRAYIGNYVRCKQCEHKFLVENPVEAGHKSEPTVTQGPPLSDLLPVGIELPALARGTEHERLQGELDQLQTDHRALQAVCDQLRAELDQSRAENNRLGGRIDSITGERDALRINLGTLSPDEIGSALKDRELLRSEVNRLAAEAQAFEAERSAAAKLADEVKQRNADLKTAHADLKTARGDLKTARADLAAGALERDSIAAKLKQHTDQLEETRATRDGLEGKLRERDDQLGEAHNERDRLRIDLEHAATESEQLRTRLGEHGKATREDTDRLVAELESLRETLKRDADTHRSELAQTNARYAELENRHREVQKQHADAEELCRAHESRNQELEAAKAVLESDFQATLATERSKQAQLAEELEKLRAASEKPPARAEQPAALDAEALAATSRMRAEIEAARAQVEEMKRRLADLEFANREMIAVLGGMGIRQARPF
jgi:chromosome segregation ATPase